MKNIELVVGGVYQSDLSNTPVRIISLSNYKVFYDVWWEHLNDWGIKSSLKSKVFYYGTAHDRILNNSTFLKIDPLSDAELKVHRPDLSLQLLTFEKLGWGSKPFGRIADCEAWLRYNGIDPAALPAVDIAKLVLVPKDARGNNKKAVIANAANGNSFTGVELLFYAYNTQAPYITWKDENGIGLHRLGFEKGVPSFYTGCFYDFGTLYTNPSLFKKRRSLIRSLSEVKKLYPFKEWRSKYVDGFEQFTAANCKKAARIADTLVAGLTILKEGATAQKIDLFKTAVIAYNELNDSAGGDLLETQEREQLAELLNVISSLAGLDPKEYGNGEGIASEWRDW